MAITEQFLLGCMVNAVPSCARGCRRAGLIRLSLGPLACPQGTTLLPVPKQAPDSPNPINRNSTNVSTNTPFLIANRHLFSSDRQIALVSSAGIPLRQRSPHIDIVHLYKARGIENRHSAPCWHWSQNLGYWMSMPKLNAPAEIHWRRSNMNTRDPILMKSVEVLKDCRSLNAAAEINCPMPRSVEKVPVHNEKRCTTHGSLTGSMWRRLSCSRCQKPWTSIVFVACVFTIPVCMIALYDRKPRLGHKM